MAVTILYALIFILAPAGVLWLCRKVKWIGKIGPVLTLYILGIILGNIYHPEGLASIQDLLSNATVPLAIPLMLFGCTFRKSETRSQLLALITGIFAVIVAVIIGYLIFGRDLDEGAKIGGMLTGVYTGGTINLASLKTMLGVREETFILLNSYDMIISFLYLTFLMALGIKLFRKILPNETCAFGKDDEAAIADAIASADANPYKGLFTREGLKDAAYLIGLTLLIVGISAGLGLLAGDNAFMVVLILMLTTLGIAASFLKPVKEKKYANEIGMYLIYIFCIVVASMADLKSLDLAGGLILLGYLTLVIFGSLILQVILAKIFKIDSDTMVIASVAFICSPPFVPMMSAAMKNRRVLVSGLSIGIVGYAAGNYLGYLISQLLAVL